MKYCINLNDFTLLGSGAEGRVYLTPEGFALKIFNKLNGAKNEISILENTKSSRFFPNAIIRIGNMVVREFVAGENLYEFIEKNGLSYKLSTEIINLIEDLKILNFKRINIRNAHLFVDTNEKLMVIDPRKPFTKVTPYPKDIIKILLKHKLFDKFLKDILEYKPELLEYWIDGYNYVVHTYRHVLKYH